MNAEGGKCSSCIAPLPKSFDATCTRCGWDNQVGMRKCTACKGPIVLYEVLGFGPIGGVIGIGWIIFWRIFGLLLGAMIICAIGSLCGLVSTVFLALKCSLCGKRAPRNYLSRDEKSSFRLRRLGFLIGTVLLAAGSLVCLLLFAGLLTAGF